MKNNAMITEKINIDAEQLSITSAAGATSINYDMQDYRRAAIVANVVADSSVVGFTTVTLDLMESSAATVAGTSAAGGSAGITIGGPATLIPVTGGARKIQLEMTSVTSGAVTISLGTVVKKFTFSTSTAEVISSAQASTNLYFGSTLDSTAAGGAQAAFDSLATCINSTLAFGGDILCSTNSTSAIHLQVADSAKGRSLGFQSTDSNMLSGSVEQAVGGFNIASDELTSTLNKRYIAMKVSTASTAATVGVSVIRTGGRFNPPTFSGKLGT